MAGLSINQINLGGNLARDFEVTFTQGGTAVGKSCVVVNERKKKGDEWVEEPIFMDFTVFGKLAERCGENLKKGDTVYVAGRLQQDTWEDKNGGGLRKKLLVIANDVEFVKWGKDRRPAAPSNDPAPQEAPF